MSFSRVLIANRGEIAVRIIRACRECGLGSVAVYSEADRGALHVRLADVAVPIGPAPAAQSYLRGDVIIDAARATGAEAIHPGYGFLSENANFARACRAAGLVFVGPPAEAIDAMGGKIGARAIAVAADVPVVPGYNGDDQDDTVLRDEAERIGYPLLIKASAGGGGKGMRVVNAAPEFDAALGGARREAQAAFGDATVFLERLVLRPRHVEIQVLADAHGNVVHLGERECSIQRRHQKIVEESPSPALSPALRAEMGAAAVRVTQAAGYVNAGTVEFILDQDGRYYFLEMNTRLQVEHPVTEFVTGLDLVHLQFAVAAGEPLPFTQDDISFRGHAIEVRLYAEDPVTYLPAIGQLALLDPPDGPGVRVDTGLTTGDEVTVNYDPMIAKLIVNGADRQQAIERLRNALSNYAVLGLTTNLPLLQAVAAHPAFAAGDTHTGFLGEHPPELDLTSAPPAEVLVAAAVWEAGKREQRTEGERNDPFTTLWRANGQGVPVKFVVDDDLYLLGVARRGDGWHVTLNDVTHEVTVVARKPTELVLALAASASETPLPNVRFRFANDGQGDLLVAWQGRAYRLARPTPLSSDSLGRTGTSNAGASLAAPMPGTLIKILVSAGEEVTEGQPLLVLEAMKMEHTIVAPYAGVVAALPFAESASVTGGVALIELDKA